MQVQNYICHKFDQVVHPRHLYWTQRSVFVVGGVIWGVIWGGGGGVWLYRGVIWGGGRGLI